MAVTPLLSPLTSTGVERSVRRAVAQLAVAVVAPALDPAAAGQRAGVVTAGGDGRHAAGQPAHVHRRDACRSSCRRPVAVPFHPQHLTPPPLSAAQV